MLDVLCCFVCDSDRACCLVFVIVVFLYQPASTICVQNINTVCVVFCVVYDVIGLFSSGHNTTNVLLDIHMKMKQSMLLSCSGLFNDAFWFVFLMFVFVCHLCLSLS